MQCNIYHYIFSQKRAHTYKGAVLSYLTNPTPPEGSRSPLRDRRPRTEVHWTSCAPDRKVSLPADLTYLQSKNKCTAEFHSAVHFFMDLRGVEPLSESPSTTASSIIVCHLTFPPLTAGKQAESFSSFMIRLYAQSFAYIVSYIVDARVLMCRCTRSDSCH